jgi:hypothetical protein
MMMLREEKRNTVYDSIPRYILREEKRNKNIIQ